MRNRLALSIVVAIAAVPPAASATPAGDTSKCVAMTAAEHRARAHVVFDGVALDGPTATRVQRFRVTRYVKGRGPAVARVQTGVRVRADGSGSSTTVSVLVRRGERWRIFARRSASGRLKTTLCDGSRRR